jgi:hypothetical protein
LKQDNEEMKKVLDKWKDKYGSCKEECQILRIEV